MFWNLSQAPVGSCKCLRFSKSFLAILTCQIIMGDRVWTFWTQLNVCYGQKLIIWENPVVVKLHSHSVRCIQPTVFSLIPNQHQPAATSQPAVIFSRNKSAPASGHSTANRVNIYKPLRTNTLQTESPPTELCITDYTILHPLLARIYTAVVAVG